jgi:hypothetical protein
MLPRTALEALFAEVIYGEPVMNETSFNRFANYIGTGIRSRATRHDTNTNIDKQTVRTLQSLTSLGSRLT